MLSKRTIVIATLGLVITTVAYAQSTQLAPQTLQVQGLAVTPFIIETNIEAGQTQEKTITLTNTTDSDLPIGLSINDFVPDSKGQAKFLGVDEDANPAYALSSWIKVIKQPSFIIPPHQQTDLTFSITPPNDAVPGTHYGGLLFFARPKTEDKGTTQVTEKVGVVILARFGHGTEVGSITSFLAEPGADNFQFFLSFYNSGNVHLKPKGDINIIDIFGHEVASVPVNRDAQIVLPDSQRVFESQWKPGWRFGRFTATAILYYGNPKLEIRESHVIWIIPIRQILLLLVIILILGYLLRIMVKRYNRYILKRAGNFDKIIKPPQN